MVGIVRIPSEGVETFSAYEDGVMPLQSEHGAVMERRLRTTDGTTEIHVMRFPSQAAFDAYMNDPRRQEFRHLFDTSGASMEAFEMQDMGH